MLFESVLDYDERGNLVRDTYSDDDGGSSVTTYEHDDSGLLRRRLFRNDAFGDIETFEYDALGRLASRMTMDEADETLVFERSDYVYGDDGLPAFALETFFDVENEAGEIVDQLEREIYTHDAEGRLTGLQVNENDDGSIEREISYEYDASGNMIRQTFSDAGGSVTGSREFAYEAVDEPIYNRWRRVFRFFL